MEDTFKFQRADWIEFFKLSDYGFDDQILTGLMKHDIMPKGIRHKGKLYVNKREILTLIHNMILVNLQVRDATDAINKQIDDHNEALAEILETAQPIETIAE